MSVVKNIHKICHELSIKNYIVRRVDKLQNFIPLSSFTGKLPDFVFICEDLFEYDYYFFKGQSYSIIKLQLSFILNNPDDFTEIPHYHFYEE
jgi:hypothetical protein